LTDDAIDVPTGGVEDGIPVTYVPARNTILLSLALGWAEVLGASAIYIGVNDIDYSGYPDCRPEFIAAFQQLINLATKATVQGATIQIQTPHYNACRNSTLCGGPLPLMFRWRRPGVAM
jgi:7-cyano-7-deazaguanine synthase